MQANALFTNQHRGKGLIGTLTGLLSLYLSFAMWEEFNDSLGSLVGPAIGVVIGTIVFLLYQPRKMNVNLLKVALTPHLKALQCTEMQTEECNRWSLILK